MEPDRIGMQFSIQFGRISDEIAEASGILCNSTFLHHTLEGRSVETTDPTN